MSLYAQIDASGIVQNIIIANENFINQLPDKDFYVNGDVDPFSKKPRAGIGYTYDRITDTFFYPKPYPSWILDDDYNWISPEPLPTGIGSYEWSEELKKWTTSQ